MKIHTKIAMVFLSLFFCSGHVGYSLADNDQDLPISGLVGMTAGLESGWLAIKVDFSENEALNGILWYNNDQGVIFPRLLVGTGLEDSPGLISEALPVASGISGGSLQQCELTFTQPIGASLDGLYVIFEFPGGQAFTSEGTGGGPGVGFFLGDEGSHGWISGDGENWMALADEYRFAIVPLLVPFVEGMSVKSMDVAVEDQPAEDVVVTEFLKAGPNPFNPQVELKFGLPTAGKVDLDIYNIRGERIIQLIDGHLAAGSHAVIWAGKNSNGQKVASGVYFARFSTDKVVLTQRLVMVK